MSYIVRLLYLNRRNMHHEASRDHVNSRGRTHLDHETHSHLDQQFQTLQEVKQQNTKLKKLLKDAQAKRTHITKQCSHLSKNIELLEQQNHTLKGQVKEQSHKSQGQKYRWEELKFLNKQYSSQLEELRSQNESLAQKLRYSSDILERKYEQLQQKTYKRMQQCIKRVKKSIHYLQSLSVKNIDKTREDLIQNLRKSIELLRGKYYEQMNCEGEIEELMNPLKTMQEEITNKTKQANHYKQQNMRLIQQIGKYRQMEKEQIPMFKQAVQKLKKNLAQVRSQLSQNQYQKMQLKKKYEEKLKEAEHKYHEVFKQCRKIKLEKKIYENKLEELEADVEQQKQRLMGQNQMLKKLYHNNQDSSSSRVSQTSNYKLSTLADKKTLEKKVLKKNQSTNQLKTSHYNQSEAGSHRGEGELSDYNEQNSMVSQQNLKHEICRIDQEIMQIQRNLNKQLQAYR